MLFPSDERTKPRRAKLVLGLMFLALSLGSVHHAHEGWRSSEQGFEIRADRWELGTPLPWLSWCNLGFTGDAPPIESVPDGSEYLPGLRMDAVLLALALACAGGLTWIGAKLWQRLRLRLVQHDSLPAPLGLILIASCGVLLRLLVEADPTTWVGWAYALVPLPLTVVALCLRRPRTWLAAVYVATGILGMELTNMAFEGRPLVDRAVDPRQDFVSQLSFFMLDLLIVAAILALVRQVRTRRRQPVS